MGVFFFIDSVKAFLQQHLSKAFISSRTNIDVFHYPLNLPKGEILTVIYLQSIWLIVFNLLDIKVSFHIFSLACLCAEKARENGYDAFGLQFYGECWTGDNAKDRYSMFGAANVDECIMSDFEPCDINSEQECVGKHNTNYVYTLEKGISFDVHVFLFFRNSGINLFGFRENSRYQSAPFFNFFQIFFIF